MHLNDRDIATAIKNNPETGFRLLMDKYNEALYWHIRRLLVTHHDTQDALQNCMIRAFRNFDKLDCHDKLRTWLYRIATNEALRIISMQNNSQSLTGTIYRDIASMTADEYIDLDNRQAVIMQQAILKLPTKQQLTFNMRYYDEMDYDDIASAIGSTASSVKANYHLAKNKIIEYIKSNI